MNQKSSNSNTTGNILAAVSWVLIIISFASVVFFSVQEKYSYILQIIFLVSAPLSIVITPFAAKARWHALRLGLSLLLAVIFVTMVYIGMSIN